MARTLPASSGGLAFTADGKGIVTGSRNGFPAAPGGADTTLRVYAQAFPTG